MTIILGISTSIVELGKALPVWLSLDYLYVLYMQ